MFSKLLIETKMKMKATKNIKTEIIVNKNVLKPNNWYLNRNQLKITKTKMEATKTRTEAT